MNRKSSICLSFLLLVSSAMSFGCENEESSSSGTPPGDTAAEPGTVRGTVTYAGTKTGSLKLSIFKSFPPTGTPVASARYPNAKFPAAYEMVAPAGDYKVLAFLDVVDDGYMPAEGDPTAAPGDTSLAPGGVDTVDLVVSDAPPPLTP